jgi:hypothetical protein
MSRPEKPAKPPLPPAKATRAPPPAKAPAGRERWQRTVRYGWDKGGAKGGRK